ncbi:hypothetical protein F4679DRAFT_597871 [Xylaria curta]|nr:hypothetical protein F4679DRAFT_597871 [Xylaria curta]
MAAEAEDAAWDSLPIEESADEGVSVSNIDGTHDYQDEQPFPNSKFPFFKQGTSIDPTIAQNAEWISRIQEGIVYEMPDSSFSKRTSSATKHRILYMKNRLGMNEKHLEDIEDPEEYWKAVMKIAPPRPWMDASEVMKHLARVRPMEKPSISNLWRDAKALLTLAIMEGSYHRWENDANIRISKIEPEFWEALRIVGDAGYGHGIFPYKLRNKLASVGLAWIFVNPEERILPQCWEKCATRQGLQFYKSMPVMHQELDGGEAAALIPTGETISSGQSYAEEHSSMTTLRSRYDLARGGPPIMPDEQRQYFQDLYRRAEQGGPAYLEGSQMQHRVSSKGKAPVQPQGQPATSARQPVTLQDVPRPTIEGEPFVESNVGAANALRSMRAKDAGGIQPPPRMTISRPIDYANIHRVWAASEENTIQLSTNITKLHGSMSNEIEKVVFTAMKHAIDDGPIEGKIREVLTTTLQKAGLQNKDVMQSTIEELVAISTERDRKVVESVQATISGLAQRIQALERKMNSQANPVAQAQPTDSQHTTQVIPQKRKNFWE